jgi:hypothetical protein
MCKRLKKDVLNGTIWLKIKFIKEFCLFKTYKVKTFHKLIFMAFLIILPINIFAQDDDRDSGVLSLPDHELGDQFLSINAGFLVPLFFHEFGGDNRDTNLSLGGVTAFQWNSYLSSFFRLGLEISPSFNISPNKKPLLMLPITVKSTFVFNAGRFEFPVFLGIGINVLRYRDWKHVDFIMKPGAGVVFRINANWGVGVNIVYWLSFQPATKYQPDNQSRLGNFLEISPCLTYHF